MFLVDYVKLFQSSYSFKHLWRTVAGIALIHDIFFYLKEPNMVLKKFFIHKCWASAITSDQIWILHENQTIREPNLQEISVESQSVRISSSYLSDILVVKHNHSHMISHLPKTYGCRPIFRADFFRNFVKVQSNIFSDYSILLLLWSAIAMVYICIYIYIYIYI